MNLERLVEFVTIAGCGSLRTAAEQLQISVATLSQRLSTFEKSLNTQLFIRDNSGLTLTLQGERFYQDATQIVAHYQKVKENMSSTPQISYDHVRIAVTGTDIPLHLGPYLDGVNERFPDSIIDIMDDSQYSIEDGLRSGKVDMYFGPVMSHVEYPDIKKHIIASPHQYVVMPNAHPASRKNAVSMQDLAGSRFILYPSTREPAIREFQLQNIAAAHIPYSIYESDSSPLFFRFLAPIGKGVLLTPSLYTEELPHCVVLPVTDITYPAPLSLFYLKDLKNPSAKQFIEGFLQFAKESMRHDNRKTF